jgi:uncharacterized protein YeaO (DUF488 family)
MNKIKRAYDSVDVEDGIRFLVDRLAKRHREEQIEGGSLA